jgi:hypothetical protein
MENKGLRGLPSKTIKRILCQECGGQISTESVEYIQSFLTNQLKQICKSVVIKQEEMNNLRKFHGLPPKRRFEVSLFISLVSQDIYSPPELDGLSKEAESVNPTPLPKYKANEEVV